VASVGNQLRFGLLVAAGFGLSACAAAVVPLTAAEIGVGGYEAYKLVQTSEGGSVGVSFAKTDGKEAPPKPLPPARHVAIWPGDEHERYLAEQLQKSGQFTVDTPGKVRVILANANISTNIKDLTDAERIGAFSIVCRKTRSDLVLAARDAGSVNHANSLSLSPANRVMTADLMAFSCAQRTVVWRDEMNLKVEIGDKTPSTEAIAKVGGDAWADRIVAAETRPPPATQIGEAY
jgi:hypothetical protein